MSGLTSPPPCLPEQGQVHHSVHGEPTDKAAASPPHTLGRPLFMCEVTLAASPRMSNGVLGTAL